MPSLLLIVLLFVLGLLVGSFLNVCIWRLPRGESIVEPPSHCPKCDTRLRAIDLVPLFSQLFLRGRCRYCGARISWRYFGIELLTGVLFALAGAAPGVLAVVAQTGWSAPWPGDYWRLARDLVFMASLVVVFWVDYDTRLIQLEAVFLLGLAGVAFDFSRVWQGLDPLAQLAWFGGTPLLPASLPQSILAMVVTAGVLWLLREGFSWLYGKEALGFGDVILVAGIAACLGWNATLITFFILSVVVGAFVGVALQIPRATRAFRWAKRRRARYSSFQIPSWPLARHAFRKAIPFGPMLAIGAVIALLYGASLNQAYLHHLNR
jgi:leader peptidase (prepilin peptidase)/N-methyltransferase